MTRMLTVIANVATIAACVVLATLLIGEGTANEPAERYYQPGERIEIPGFDFTGSPRTLLFVIANACRFCEASMPFYRSLNAVRRPGTRFVAVSADPLDESRSQLDAYQVQIDLVVQKDPSNEKLGATPMLLMVDSKGTVERAWLGLLYEHEEAEVVAAIRSEFRQR